eukprot:TRINITY_DN21642_c0_g1_i1.p1 TRINITY_DN21642_c0_g1~~TRINITY_DN21642_c0_g1_i1.p1  ORF type:complete len:505 (+),score=129.42 TRINITY_DN21642_c0_g1_i1:57-1571(+)
MCDDTAGTPLSQAPGSDHKEAKWGGPNDVVNNVKKTVRRRLVGDENKSVRKTANQKVREELKKPKTIRLMDRCAFCLGVFGIILTQYFIMLQPGYFCYYYLCIIPPLVAVRYNLYRRKKMHYFLIDFCYFMQVLLAINTAFNFLNDKEHAPSDESRWLPPPAPVPIDSFMNHLFKINFLFANGPLSIAIIAWRNSLVFHSLDKVTSIFIHAFPMAITFCDRWYSGRYADFNDPVTASDFGTAIIVYLIWQSGYLLETEVRIRKKFDSDAELSSSLRYLAKHGTAIPVVVVVRKVCVRMGFMRRDEEFSPYALKTKLVMVMGQLIFTLVTLLPAWLCYSSYTAHMMHAMLVMWFSVWNGATYYFEVFAGRYAHARDGGSGKSKSDNPTPDTTQSGGGAGVVFLGGDVSSSRSSFDSSSCISCPSDHDVSEETRSPETTAQETSPRVIDSDMSMSGSCLDPGPSVSCRELPTVSSENDMFTPQETSEGEASLRFRTHATIISQTAE